MGHTPYGYRIENGCAVINEEEAAKIRKLYENYFAGMAQSKAAIEAGIETYHSSAKRLMCSHLADVEIYISLGL